jgi:uncharacterized surface protein with fasciclin (FAS1) repeats
MKKSILTLALVSIALWNCKSNEAAPVDAPATTEQQDTHSQDGIVDNDSDPTVVNLAVKNPDLSTLVKAVQTAGLVTSLSNAGPFTVFAPLNSAFDKLPAGTVDDLLKPENKDKLSDILGHHTYVGVIKPEQFTDGQNLGMVDGKSITIKMVNGKPTVNGTINIVASVPASNGIVHVVDAVILPE